MARPGATLAERIQVGLFTVNPAESFDAKHVIIMEPMQIRSGTQVLKFVTDRKPTHAGVDPYGYYIDRDANDNVLPVINAK